MGSNFRAILLIFKKTYVNHKGIDVNFIFWAGFIFALEGMMKNKVLGLTAILLLL